MPVILKTDYSALPPKPVLAYNAQQLGREIDILEYSAIIMGYAPNPRIAELRKKFDDTISDNKSELKQWDELKERATGRYYIPGPLTPHQLHRLTDAKWTPPDKGQQTYPTGTATILASMSTFTLAGMGIIAMQNGGIPQGILAMLAGFAFLMLAIVTDFPKTLAPLHNARIKRTNVDDLKLYLLDHQITLRLKDRLSGARWRRLNDKLANDDPEIGAIFVDYYEKMAETQEMIEYAGKGSVDKKKRTTRLHDLNERADLILQKAEYAISAIFDCEDDVKQATIEASLEKSELDKILHDTIIGAKVDAILSQPV